MDKTLYFLRHATAELRQPELPDRPRQLIAKGQAQAQRVAAFMQRQQLAPEWVFASPYPRASQTAQIVCDVAMFPAYQPLDWLALETPTEQALAALRQLLPQLPSQTLFVGHEPDFSLLISGVLGTAAEAMKIKKASLCCVLINSQSQRAQLQWLLPVQLM
jgi:phosphohistidine phosphatase